MQGPGLRAQGDIDRIESIKRTPISWFPKEIKGLCFSGLEYLGCPADFFGVL